MAVLTIKNLPDPLYAQLKQRASENRRSLNSEAILAVERALQQPAVLDAAKLIASVRRTRGRVKGVHLTDVDLRSARDAGRA